jgi:hypothetical protein
MLEIKGQQVRFFGWMPSIGGVLHRELFETKEEAIECAIEIIGRLKGEFAIDAKYINKTAPLSVLEEYVDPADLC